VTHPERGVMILDRLAEELSELGTVEQRPTQDGRNMTMMLGPSKAVLAGKADGAEYAEDGAEPAESSPDSGASAEASPDGAVKVEIEAPADTAAPASESPNGVSDPAVS
jgi:translation initiation factor IF-3